MPKKVILAMGGTFLDINVENLLVSQVCLFWSLFYSCQLWYIWWTHLVYWSSGWNNKFFAWIPSYLCLDWADNKQRNCMMCPWLVHNKLAIYWCLNIIWLFQVIGVVFNPVMQEMFTAVKGRGAFLNKNTRLQVLSYLYRLFRARTEHLPFLFPYFG